MIKTVLKLYVLIPIQSYGTVHSDFIIKLMV